MAQYSISYNEDKQQMNLKIFTPLLEEEDAKMTVATDEVVFICAPYFLRIKPLFNLVPAEYFPKYNDEKFVFEYKIKLQPGADETKVETGDVVSETEAPVKYTYGINSSFTDNLDLMRDEMNEICGIGNPDLLSAAQRREKRLADEKNDFKLDSYKHDYWHVHTKHHRFILNHDIPLDIGLSKEDKLKIEDLVKKPLASTQVADNTKINLGLLELLFCAAYDWRINGSETNDSSSAWTRLTLSGTLKYFDEFDSLEDLFRSFYRRALIYPLYRAKVLVRCCIDDVVRGLETEGQAWILKQLLTTYTLFNLNNYCILNRYYIVEYIKYVYRFITDDDANQLAEIVKNFHVKEFIAENHGFNLEQVDIGLMHAMFNDNIAGENDSDDDEEGSAHSSTDSDDDNESDEEDQEEIDKVLTDKLKEMKV